MSITPSGYPQPPEPEPAQRAEASREETRSYGQPAAGYYAPAPAPISTAVPTTGRAWFQPAVIVALIVLVVASGYLFYDLGATRHALEQQLAQVKERNSVLERRASATEQRQNALRADLQVSQEKLGITQRDLSRARALAQSLGEEQKQAEAELQTRLGQVGQQVVSLREEAGQKLGALSGEVSGAKTDIVATRKELEQTRIQLTSAIGDISKQGVLIARNHDELVELKRRGERNYHEFDLPKEKQPRRIGDVSLLLKKADPKRMRYTVEVIAEDARTEKKDKTVNEPVQFYMGRSRALFEIVVNRVGKDRITGYLSTPK